MKKELIVSAIVVLLIGIIGLVYASQIEAGAPIYKGWNLLYSFSSPDQLSGHLEKSHIKAIYAFIPTTQEYARVYPNPENSKIDKIGDGYLEKTAFWVYSDYQTGETLNGMYNGDEYMAQEPLPLNDLPLYSGWNFVAILPEMIGKTFNELKGSCIITKVYWWQPREQKFISVDLSSSEVLRAQQNVGSGMIVKVVNNCKMGASSDASNVNPLSIPN